MRPQLRRDLTGVNAELLPGWLWCEILAAGLYFKIAAIFRPDEIEAQGEAFTLYVIDAIKLAEAAQHQCGLRAR